MIQFYEAYNEELTIPKANPIHICNYQLRNCPSPTLNYLLSIFI